MGVVYRAQERPSTARWPSRCCRTSSRPTPAAARRFVDEARITGQLQHPGIPPVHELGTLPDGRPFLAMKLIKGRTLDRPAGGAARPGGRPRPVRGRRSSRSARRSAYAHAHGVIHRDLKPANVMVGAFGEVQVMDWGLAKVLGRRGRGRTPTGATTADGDGRSDRLARPGRTSTRRPGACWARRRSCRPEQAVGAVDQIDARSDVFGLGGDPVRDPDRPAAVRRRRRPRRRRQLAGQGEAGRLPSPGWTAAGRSRSWSPCASGAWPRSRPTGRPTPARWPRRWPGCGRRPRSGPGRRAGPGRAAGGGERAKPARGRGRRPSSGSGGGPARLAVARRSVLAAGGAFALVGDRQARDRERAEAGRQAAEAGVRAGLEQAVAMRRQYRFANADAAVGPAPDLATADASALLPRGGPVGGRPGTRPRTRRGPDEVRAVWIRAEEGAKGRFDAASARPRTARRSPATGWT